MIILAIYTFFLFLFGLGTAVVTYHILRYRDPDDISGIVLGIYYVLVIVIVVGTALMIDWQRLFTVAPTLIF
jgi:hypothetical protein